VLQCNNDCCHKVRYDSNGDDDYLGRSHDESFVLYDLGDKSSEGVRIFAETGASDVLDQLSQGEGGIYDEFIAPSVLQGVGSTHAEFFVDGNHSRVRENYFI
jgi:hypothetical protein